MHGTSDGLRTNAKHLLRRVLHPGQPAMRGCTIVARNYLAQAEVLAHSFQEYHPDCPFAILLVDDLHATESRNDGIELLALTDIGLEPGDAYRMPMLYNGTELVTAVKPWLLRRFLNGGTESVIYFDPDIEIFSPLYDLAALARKHSIVLTPHITEPIPRDQLRPSESDILGAGIYNLGFIGLGPGGEPFLDWWAAPLRRESESDPARMRFSGQRRIDFVPSLFPHHVVRDPGVNVAYWNLHSRQLKWEGDRYKVNGKTLRFFHYSGYDPNKPHLLSKHQGDQPRVLLSQHPGVARICNEYRKKLVAAGFNGSNRSVYGFAQLSNGLKIDQHVRKLYRDALDRCEKHDEPEPPSPFAPGGEETFVSWLNEPLRATRPLVTRFMLSLHTFRGDLQNAFPEPLGADAEAFSGWFLQYGRHEASVHDLLLPADAPSSNEQPLIGIEEAAKQAQTPRVSVVGYFRAELGIGEAARLLVAGLEATNTPYNTVSYDNTESRQRHPFEEQPGEGSQSDINIVCINADQTPGFAQRMGPRFSEGRYTVGVWFWEVEDFPPSYHPAFDHVDEVWVATEFMRQTLLKVSPKPVFKFHLPIVRPTVDESLTRTDVGLPDRFTFLFSFDFLSVLERKNPMGIIQAFKRAFQPGEGPALVIKSINGEKRIPQLEIVRLAAGRHPDIIVSDGYFSSIQKNTMMARCDCYVSLHRSEGYGLTLAEAMALGKPVIATDYSGNLEFMTPENSYLCACKYREIGSDADPYLPTSRWAEPHIDEAARFMREVYSNHEEAGARGRRAASDMAALHSPIVAGSVIRDRIAAIRGRRALPGETLAVGTAGQHPEIVRP